MMRRVLPIIVLLSSLLVAWGLVGTWKWVEPEGVVATFYRGTNFEHFAWITTPKELNFALSDRLARKLRSGRFSARWTGSLSVPQDGEYTFATLSHHGIRLFIDDDVVINNWHDQEWTESGCGAVKQLSQGKHRLRVEFYGDAAGARFRVEWCGGQIPPRTIIGPQFLRKWF